MIECVDDLVEAVVPVRLLGRQQYRLTHGVLHSWW